MCSKAGSALSINIFVPLFSICYISMGANGWPAVATRSQQDFQDQTPMIVRSLVENRVEAPGVGSRDQATRIRTERGVTRPYGRKPNHGEDTSKATGASEKDVAQECGCYTREGEGTAEADVQCQSLPSGRLSGGWFAELREIPRSRHEQGHQWPAAGARHPLHPAV